MYLQVQERDMFCRTVGLRARSSGSSMTNSAYWSSGVRLGALSQRLSMDGGAPAPLAAVEPSDLTEMKGRSASAEPTARFLNALLAKVEALQAQQQVVEAERKAVEAQAAQAAVKIRALEAQQKATEAESRALKAGLVPLIKSVAAAPREAPAEGVPGETQQGDELVFVPAAGLESNHNH